MTNEDRDLTHKTFAASWERAGGELDGTDHYGRQCVLAAAYAGCTEAEMDAWVGQNTGQARMAEPIETVPAPAVNLVEIRCNCCGLPIREDEEYEKIADAIQSHYDLSTCIGRLREALEQERDEHRRDFGELSRSLLRLREVLHPALSHFEAELVDACADVQHHAPADVPSYAATRVHECAAIVRALQDLYGKRDAAPAPDTDPEAETGETALPIEPVEGQRVGALLLRPGEHATIRRGDMLHIEGPSTRHAGAWCVAEYHRCGDLLARWTLRAEDMLERWPELAEATAIQHGSFLAGDLAPESSYQFANGEELFVDGLATLPGRYRVTLYSSGRGLKSRLIMSREAMAERWPELAKA